MDFRYVLSALAGLVFLLAFVPYIGAIWRGETRPRTATWFVWALGDIIVVLGMLANDTISGQMAAACLGASTVFFLSLYKGESGWSRLERVCVALSLIAIGMWLYFGDSNLGIAFSLLSLGIAAWPTYVSTWKNPENEDAKGWLIFELSSILAVLAIPRWSFADAAPAIAFLIIDTPMMYLLFVRPFFKYRRSQFI